MENKHISSFMGFAPANDPKIVVLFIVDEPDAYVDFGSVIAGPYVKDVIEQAMQYMKAVSYTHLDVYKRQVEDGGGPVP